MRLRIKDLREDNDLTQTDVAKILNCSQQTYSRYETGEIKINLESLIVLADFYSVSLDYISGRSNKKIGKKQTS